VWTIPWPSSLFPEGAIVGLIAAIAGGVLGGYLGRSLDGQPTREPASRFAIPAAALAVMVLVGYGLQMPTPSKPPTATVTTTTVKPNPKREIQATVKLTPPDAAKNAHWFTATAWQGGGSVVDPLKKIGPGLYKTTQPLPVYGNWKVTLRLERKNQVLGLPIFFPSDPAIPAPLVPATRQFTRPFVRDKKNLQREQKSGTSGVLSAGAYTIVLIVGLTMFALLAWGLMRLSRALRERDSEPPLPSSPPAAEPRTPTPA
jgi:hypothetical protein